MAVQEVIVYRNPAEAMFWQSMASGDFVPFIFGFVVLFVVLLSVDGLLGKLKLHKLRNSYFSLVLAVIASILAIKIMWI
jgi:hypothetical protein